MKYLIPLLFSFSSYATIVKYDVVGPKKDPFMMSEVCDWKGVKDAPLMEADSIRIIDCMGIKVNVQDFCLAKVSRQADFIRGYWDHKSKRVICQSAKSVVVKYKCTNHSQQRFCQNPEIACEGMKSRLAYNLKLFKSSLSLAENKKIGIKYLHCHYIGKAHTLEQLNKSLF